MSRSLLLGLIISFALVIAINSSVYAETSTVDFDGGYSSYSTPAYTSGYLAPTIGAYFDGRGNSLYAARYNGRVGIRLIVTFPEPVYVSSVSFDWISNLSSNGIQAFLLNGATGVDSTDLYDSVSSSTWQTTDAALSGTGDTIIITLWRCCDVGSGYYIGLDDIVIVHSDSPPVADFEWTPSVPGPGTAIDFTDLSTQEPYDWDWDFGDGATSTDQNPTHAYADPGSYSVELTVTNTYGSDSVTYLVIVATVGTLPSGVLYKPLAEEDIDPLFGIRDVKSTRNPDSEDRSLWGDVIPDDYMVSAISALAGAEVYAVADGQVMAIESIAGSTSFLNYAYCGGAWSVGVLGDCIINEFILDSLTYYMYRFDRTNLYAVYVKYDDTSVVEYIVEDATRYVQQGSTIAAGCIIGLTTDLIPVLPTQLESIGISVDPELTFGFDDDALRGLAMLSLFEQGDGEELSTNVMRRLVSYGSNDNFVLSIENEFGVDLQRDPLLNMMTEAVDPGQACNLDPDTAACRWVDPELQDRTQWQTAGGVQWLSGGGAILQPGAYIVGQGLRLSPETAYELTVNAERLGGSGSIVLTLGESTSGRQTMTYPNADYVIASAVHEPDDGSLYSVSIENAGGGAIQINSLCITDGSNPGTGESTCAFTNYSFTDSDADGWTTTGTINAGVTGGAIVAYDDATLMQTLHLYPDGASPHTYYVDIIARLYGDFSEAADTVTVDFTYRYPSSAEAETGHFINTTNNQYPVQARVMYAQPGRMMVFRAGVTVTEAINAGFRISVNLAGSGLDGGWIEILEACVNDPFTHHPAGGGGRGNTFNPACEYISPPADESVGSWLFYHWQQLDRFFQCDLMILLNRIDNVTYGLYEFAQWQAIYWQAVADMSVKWIGYQFVPWLNGHFGNIALGQTTTISSAGCDNVWCVLDSVTGTIDSLLNGGLNLLGSAVEILGQLIGGGVIPSLINLINLSINLMAVQLQMLLALFNQLSTTVSAILNAITTAEPQSVPGLPTCAINPRENFMCITMWGAEHTILSGTGALFIPFLIGLGSLQLMLWTVRAIRKEIEKGAG
jgi:PKD repeat protein